MYITIKYKDNTTELVFLDTSEEVQNALRSFIDAFQTDSRCLFLDTKRRALLVVLDDVRTVEYINNGVCNDC